jgi:hypothetical protein
MLIKLKNENKLYDVITDDAIRGVDYELGEFECPYADECSYNNGKAIHKCIGIIKIVRKNCLLESVRDSADSIPKDNPFYMRKGEIRIVFQKTILSI